MAPVPLRRGRLPELERMFGTTVVVTDAATTDSATLLEAAASLAVDAVVLDVVAPAAMPQLIDALAAYRLLRPAWVETRTSRGERQPRFAGYGLVGRDGTLRPVGDGELVPRD